MSTPSTGFVSNVSGISGDLSVNFAALNHTNTFTGTNNFTGSSNNFSGLETTSTYYNQINTTNYFGNFGQMYQTNGTLAIIANIATNNPNGYIASSISLFTTDMSGLQVNPFGVSNTNMNIGYGSNVYSKIINGVLTYQPSPTVNVNCTSLNITCSGGGAVGIFGGYLQCYQPVSSDTYFCLNSGATMVIGGGSSYALLSIGNTSAPTTISGSSVSIPTGINYSYSSYSNDSQTFSIYYYNDGTHTYTPLYTMNLISSNHLNSGTNSPLNINIYLPQITSTNESTYLGQTFRFRRTLGSDTGNVNLNSCVIYAYTGNYISSYGAVWYGTTDNTFQSVTNVSYMVIKTSVSKQIYDLSLNKYVWLGYT